VSAPVDEQTVNVDDGYLVKDKQASICLYFGLFEVLVAGHQFHLERRWTAANEGYQ
jgi:hypothetical protein